MHQGQEQALPMLHPVTDYEKIKRVGEGTYGVVCEAVMSVDQSFDQFIFMLYKSEGKSLLQTRQDTEKPVILLLLRSLGWTENEMVHMKCCRNADAFSLNNENPGKLAGCWIALVLFGSHRHASHLCP